VTSRGYRISIALNNSRAQGFVFLEENEESDFKTELYKITVIDQLISFDQENIFPQKPPSPNENLIDGIMITFIGIDKPINTACALKRDLKTV
jgi:hypothetical protein